MKIKSFGKINLNLRVLDELVNGLHKIESLIVPIDLYDVIEIKEIKNDKDGNLSLSIGRKSFTKDKLQENIKFFFDFLKKEKPENLKGEFIKNIHLTSTMGISYKIGSKI